MDEPYFPKCLKDGREGVSYAMGGKRIKIFSFFSGSGFLDLGFEKAGFEVVFANEYSPVFMEAYQYARGQMGMPLPAYGCHACSIDEFLDGRRKELIRLLADARADGSLAGFIGGPPCPDFSVAGKNRGRDGENGKLSLSYVELICDMKPDFFLFENVKGLWSTARHREYFEELKRMLRRAGYATTERLVNALEYGVPQDRERILLFGVRQDVLARLGMDISAFPWGTRQKYSTAEVKAMPWPGTEPFLEGGSRPCPPGIPKELTVEHWFKKNHSGSHPNAQDCFTPKAGLARMQSVDEGDVGRKSYKRLHRWRYSPTAAYGNNEVHLHPYRARRLTAAEAMAIQSLPEEFVLPPDMPLSAKFKTIGNGVPFLLAEGIACAVRDFLGGVQAGGENGAS